MKTPNINYFLALVFSSFVASSAQAAAPLTSVSSVVAGFYHTCTLTTAGGVKCWGYNNYGQLGDNTTADRHTPVAVMGLSSGVVAVAAAGANTCVLTSAGGVKCWGANSGGLLGDNTTTDRHMPVDVVGLSSGVMAISTGGSHTCVLTSAGGMKCWGSNSHGQLGDNQASGGQSKIPVDVVGLGGSVTAISSGGSHTCALTSAGGVECWGYNYYGQLGDNTTTDQHTPVAVVGLSSGVVAIAASYYHTCALTSGGGVKCWGYNSDGQLGDNTKTDRYTPVGVVGLSSGVVAIAVGHADTCALTSVGGVKCWGMNGDGELGDNQASGGQSKIPVDVVGLGGSVTAISSGGGYHTCALTSVGTVQCWGFDGYGQLGDNSTGDVNYARLAPVDVVVLYRIDNDFDGDRKSDVLFLNSTTGGTQYWKAATKSQAVYPGAYDTSYMYAGSGDFDGDGKVDLLFTKSSNNGTLIWNGAVKTAASYPGTSTAGFTVAAICDVNGDGKDDVVWFNATTGGTQIWPAATKASATYPGAQGTAYTLAACGDFDNDGKADLFWRNNTTGANEIWLSANKSTKSYPGAYTDLTWSVVGAGDIDADGKSDVVWYQSTTGKTMVWKGGLKSAAIYPGSNATTFTPKAIGDYDGDGKADLLWSNDTTLGTQIWSGILKTVVTYPGTYTTGFTIQK